MLGLAACTGENELPGENTASEKGNVQKVVVTVTPLNERSETRTTLSKNLNNKTVFVWNEQDAIGIFPDEGNQIGFSMSDGAGTTQATFTGGGWGLKSSSTYAAYYPLIEEFKLDRTSIPFQYIGQTQDGNGSSNHLGAYDFMAASASAPSNGTVNFAFCHLGTLLHFKFTVPEDGTYSSIVLRTDGAFATHVALNLPENVVTPTSTADEMMLKLQNVSLLAGDVLDAYMLIAAVDLSGNTLEASVYNVNGSSYTTALSGQNFVGGDVWNYTRTLTNDGTTQMLNGHEYVDLGITDDDDNPVYWATTNLGASAPSEYGGYYAWGETVSFGEEDRTNIHNYETSGSYTKAAFNYATYKWSTGSEWTEWKYINKYTFADGQVSGYWYDNDGTYIGDDKTVLESDDDAATVNWGEGWRLPTSNEMTRLKNSCCWVWVDSPAGYMIYQAKCAVDKGYFGTSPRESYSEETDAHIFLPAAGSIFGSDVSDAGNRGSYMLSELGESASWKTITLYFKSDDISVDLWGGYGYRCDGRSVRPVCTIQN